jgi:hypothetical protein
MKIHSAKQGSAEWLKARSTIPTASCFDRILTPGKLEPSKSQGKYLAELLAAWWLGNPLDDMSSSFMQRGTELEPEAAAWYCFDKGVCIEECGLCLSDDERAGASPDRLVDDDGILEIKCPAPATHMDYMLHGFGDYTLQVQGQLWITGRKWCDKVSYHPTIPAVVLRVERDEKIIAAIAREVGAFCDRLDELKKQYDPQRLAALNGEVPSALVTQDHPF